MSKSRSKTKMRRRPKRMTLDDKYVEAQEEAAQEEGEEVQAEEEEDEMWLATKNMADEPEL